MKSGSREEAYKMVKKFFGQYKTRAGGVEDNNVEMLYEQRDIAKRWKEYLEILYEEKILKGNEVNEVEKTEGEYEMDQVLREKFDKALKNLKNKKAAGIEEIQALEGDRRKS